MNSSQVLRAFGSSTTKDITTLVSKNKTLQKELGLTTEMLTRTGVYCQVIKEEIVARCQLRQCPYYCDIPSAHNCALVYTNEQSDNVTHKDLAIIYRKPVSEIKTCVETAMDGIRSALRDDKEPTFTLIPLKGVCVCCESPIEDETLSIEGYEYCSQRCAGKLPPTKVRSGYIPSGDPT